jgi:hypothetical protein
MSPKRKTTAELWALWAITFVVLAYCVIVFIIVYTFIYGGY